jgi:hypothetical protein
MLKMLKVLLRWFFDHPGLGAVMAVAALVGMLVLGFRADLPDAITIPLTIFVVVAGGALFVGSRRREGE